MGQAAHISVMLEECMEGLKMDPKGIYIDGTFGRGGHSQAILDRLSDGGQLHAYDVDPAAAALANAWDDPRFTFHNHSFAKIEDDMKALGLAGQINGVLLDVGVSSPQLDTADRGFSFRMDGPLDMRMNPEAGLSAKAWLNGASEAEISEVICKNGQERYHRRIAKAIVQARVEKPLEKTLELAQLVEKTVPKSFKEKKHPATRTFQAIRMHINGELPALQAGLEGGLEVLAPGGRMAVLSFHSLEHRQVRAWIKANGPGHETFSRYAFANNPKVPRLKRIGRPQTPSAVEVMSNVRARSAQLHIIEKEAIS